MSLTDTSSAIYGKYYPDVYVYH